MTVSEMIVALKEIEAQGNGHLNVYYRGGAGGDIGLLDSPTVENEADDMGPFDEDEGSEWIEFYAEQG